ncbi:MAG: hypothetical protein IKT94_01515, partial [Rikenellaceae bacterium]|nr:hypothetical protein [Rikenellaceae bacterium]
MKKYFTLLATMFVALFTVGCGEWQNETPKIPYDELPYSCDLENFEGWSNARICKDGSAVFTLDNATTHQVEKTLMLIPADTLGFVSVYGEFDEMGFPKSLAFNDAVILIDNRTDTTFNATVFVDGVAVWTAENLEFTSEVSRAWSDNNWVRNTTAVGGVITGAIGVGVGVALTGTGVGTMTGLVTIAGSCNALVDNLGVLFGPPEEVELSDEIEQYIQDKGWDNLCDGLTEHEEDFLNKWFKKHMDVLDRLSWVDLALDLVDRAWGKTITESQKRLALIIAHRSYVVETGVARDVTNHTAELWGYVSPEALSPLNKYANIEYGIVVYPTNKPSERMHQQHIIGDGGAFSLLFRGLEYNTQYSYFVYYNDKTNAIPRYGETRTFSTNEEESLRQMLIQFYKDTGGDNWINNENWCSDKPLNEWYGVDYGDFDGDGIMQLRLSLDINNLVGSGNLSGCTALMYLGCENNQLTSLDVSGCTALETLWCYDNQLTSLDVSGCTALEDLYCGGNQLTSLDVSGCTALDDLYCGGDQLTSLDVSGCTALYYLCYIHNQLTSLDVSGCTALETLWCYDNQL